VDLERIHLNAVEELMVGRLSMVLAGASMILSTQAQECNDKDWDHLQDNEDNCVDQYNPAQLDTDADGKGDACDNATHDFGGTLADCYITNYDNLRGVGWTNVLLDIGRDKNGTYGVFYWPPGEYPEFGYTPFNGRDFWIMAYGGEGTTLQTATYLEGTAVETDATGTITKFEGTYQMITCDESSCMYPDDPELWDAFQDGNWDAVAASGDKCIPPP
jgi:hypothetical protein